MKINEHAYGKLCSLYYDAVKKFAPEKEVNFFASFIEKNKGRVLEAMCGSGRLMIPLIQKGYIVDGVDNSSIMLERCRKRCAQLNLKTELYEQSLEKLSTSHKYSVVTIAVGSFQLITDYKIALQALQKIHQHMHKNGDLLIDIFVPDLNVNPRSIDTVKINENSFIRLTKRYFFNELEKIAESYCFYELIINDKVQEQENEIIAIKWYSENELIQLFNEAGFEIIKIYEETFRSSGPSRIIHAKPI